MNQKYYYQLPKNFCRFKFLEINFINEKISSLKFRGNLSSQKKSPQIKNLKKIKEWLDDYFSEKKVKNLPLSFFDISKMTPFTQQVLKQIHKVSFGKTKIYSELAENLNKPKAFRAAGTACGKNPIPLFIPCHRILGKSGLGGFSCGLDLKIKLLDWEKQND